MLTKEERRDAVALALEAVPCGVAWGMVGRVSAVAETIEMGGGKHGAELTIDGRAVAVAGECDSEAAAMLLLAMKLLTENE